MAKESIIGIDKNEIFRETFNSESDTIKNGGTPTDVTYANGKGSFNGTTSTLPTSLTGNGQFQNGFTIVAWINPDSVGGTAGRIIDKATSGSTGGIIFGMGSAENRLFSNLNAGTGVFS